MRQSSAGNITRSEHHFVGDFNFLVRAGLQKWASLMEMSITWNLLLLKAGKALVLVGMSPLTLK